MHDAHLKHRCLSVAGLEGPAHECCLLIVWDNLNDIDGAVSIHFTVPTLRAR